MKRLLLFFLLAPAAFAQCPGHSYSTTFSVNENPISQGNCWFNGTVDGTFWGNVQTSGGQAHGTITNSNPSFTAPFNDSTAVLKGTWGPNQYVRATVRINATDTSSQQEIELRTHTTITPNSTTGYEFDVNVKNGQAYVVIVRWNPGTNQFTYCQNNSTCTGTLGTNSIPAVDGDVFEANSIGSKHTLYKNGTAVFTTTDGTYTAGSPGIGFWMVDGSSQTCSGGYGTAPCSHLLDFGLSNFSASDSTYVAATGNKADVAAVVNGPTHTFVNGDTLVIPAGTWAWTGGGITFPAGIGFQIFGFGTPDNSPTTRLASASCTTGGTTITQTQFSIFASTPSAAAVTPASTTRISCLTPAPATGATFNCGGANSGVCPPIVISGTCTAAGVCPNLRMDNMVASNAWAPVSGATFLSANDVYGVADHNTVGGPVNINGTALVNMGYGTWQAVGPWGDNSWATGETLGTNQQFFIENNTFTNAIGSDMDEFPGNGDFGGGRITGRFNTFNGITGGTVLTDHGTDTTGRIRGGRQMEAYGNTITNTGSANAVFGDRSSVSIHVNNALTSGAANQFMATATQRRYRGNAVFASCDGSAPWDTNDTNGGGGNTAFVYVSGLTITSTTATGPGNQQVLLGVSGTLTPNAWVQNPIGSPYSVHDFGPASVGGAEIISNTANSITVFQPGWNGTTGRFGTLFAVGDTISIQRVFVCMDQPGRGQGFLLVGGDCNAFSTGGHLCPQLATGPGAGAPGPVNELLRPSYEADDAGTFTNKYTSDTQSLIANRNFYFEPVGQAAQTTATSPFNGTTGTGHGTLARRPTTCTTGVGYWATDQGTWNTSGVAMPDGTQQGQLYVCTATNTWNLYYAPFQYPHPLITGVTAGTVSVSPSSMNFGSVVVGTFSSAQTATLTNTTTAGVTLSPVTITGSNPADFSIGANNCNSGTVAANGGTCSVTMQFAPTSTGARSATLTIVTSAGSFPVSMSGTGTSSVNPGISINPASAAFGNITVGVPSAGTTFTMTSTTTANLVMGTPPATITGTNPGDFALVAVGGQCTNGQSIPQSSTCTERVVFTPSAAGARSAQVNIFDNVTGSPQVVPLTGTGVGTIAVNPVSLNFGAIAQGQTSIAQPVVITNNTGVTLTLTGTGFTNLDFGATSNTCNSGTLTNGQSCTVTVNFRPSATTGTNENGFLQVNNSVSNVSIPLAGTVLPPIGAPATNIFAKNLAGCGAVPKLTTFCFTATGKLYVAVCNPTCVAYTPFTLMAQ